MMDAKASLTARIVRKGKQIGTRELVFSPLPYTANRR